MATHQERIEALNLTNIHPQSVCRGEFCCIHNPSSHHMREWKMVWRYDKGVLERICPTHGVGHPDPDCAEYNRSINKGYLNIHGCCGCCNPTKNFLLDLPPEKA